MTRSTGVAERVRITPFEAAIGGAALLLSVAAFWITLEADFLAHPGWLAVQKADIILGPVLTGLYWRRRRPRSRFGPLLIAVGFLQAPYILQSLAQPWLFALGVAWESVIYVSTLALILAFPSGRLDGVVERVLLGCAVFGVTVLFIVALTLSPVLAATGSISGCDPACPPNGWLITPDAALADALNVARALLMVAIAVAAIALIVRRFATGTPARRRALAIGTPIALLFLVTQIARQSALAFGLDSGTAYTVITWTIVASRAALWYGFLAALIAAELYAGRVLRQIVERSLERPPLDELEAMLREPLGDPGLRIAFAAAYGRGWVDRAGAPLVVPPGRVVTPVEREGRPAAAIVHDAQLAEDPELVHAAGAVARLAHENAELETAWNDSLRQLRESRARFAAAADIERRALERDLHDGAQQQLTALLVKLALVRELVDDGSVAQARLLELESELEQALEELRRLAHGIYPAPLAKAGLVGALELVALRSGGTIEVNDNGVGRYPLEVETAVYFCCLEAVQNATKHAGTGARVSIRLYTVDHELRFDVRDDGPGFDPTARHDGVGLHNMRARLDAFDGQLVIDSAPGRGATISGALPIG